MFRHLLLPVDLSLDDPEQERLAIELARRAEARATLLHVVETIGGDELEDAEMRTFYQRLERRARKTLEPLVGRWADAGVDCQLEVALGNRVGEILRHAGRDDVDLVVMPSRPLAELAAGAWPTISFQVSMASPVPVLLLR